MPQNTLYDVIIIGAGPAGLTAALYTGRAALKTLVIEQGLAGGQIAVTELIENYPGFPEGILGPELSAAMEAQAKRFGAEFVTDSVVSLVDYDEPVKVVKGTLGSYRGKTIIIATGASHRELGVPGEREYMGKGTSYCATCDGAFFRGEDLVVVGGGDSAVEEGLFLTRYANSVTLIHRRDQLRAQKILQQRAFNNPKMNFVWDTVVEEIVGNEQGVTGVRTRNVKTGETGEIACGGVFIYVGMVPGTSFLPPVFERSPEGYLVTRGNTETAVPGVFAAGDCTVQVTRQAVTAAGDGCIAAIMAEKYLVSQEDKSLPDADLADEPLPAGDAG